MLLVLLAAAAASPTCTDVPRACRACSQVEGRTICSNIGIACQPLRRICRPAEPVPGPKRPAA